MKIGVVTYFNIKNYGSVLQAFATKTVLNQLGHQTVFLNVREQNVIPKLLHKIHVGATTVAKCAVNQTALQTHREIRGLRKESGAGFSQKTNDLFDAFVAKQLESRNIDRLSLRKQAHTDEYGAFICGSDQIWSPLSIHLSGYKYLDFAPANKRIAYAPSFGVSKVPDYNKAFVSKQLKGITHLSVREHDGAAIIKELTGKHAPVVLDPTLLLDAEQWRSLYCAYFNGNAGEKDYILCYFFEEPSDTICENILSYAKVNNKKIIVLSVQNKKLLSGGAQCVEAGPWEFLYLVDNSCCVFTNSFHGSVFALQFAKPLVVFGRNHSEAVKQTSRIDTLLKNTDLEQCRYVAGNIRLIETSQATEKIIPYRQDSLAFLKSSLERVISNE